MSKIKPGLGRGLDALLNARAVSDSDEMTKEISISSENSERYSTNNSISNIPVSLVLPNPFQPRTNFEPEALEELKNSIIANGLIQPVTVRRSGDRYELISGERRLRAFKEIGYSEIPAYIISVASDELMLAMALIENIQRERLNPIEVGMAFKRLMDECHLTQEEIAKRVGKDRSTIANSVRLLKLPLKIRESLIKDEISMGHARALINLTNENIQLDLLEKIMEGNLSVRKVEALVKKYLTEAGNHSNVAKQNAEQKQKDDPALNSLTDKFRKIFGTKINFKQKSLGTGEIIIEYYSDDELMRLIELFEIIEKYAD